MRESQECIANQQEDKNKKYQDIFTMLKRPPPRRGKKAHGTADKPPRIPFVKWRQLALRHQYNADKKLIICIVSSGLTIIITGIVLTILPFIVFKGRLKDSGFALVPGL